MGRDNLHPQRQAVQCGNGGDEDGGCSVSSEIPRTYIRPDQEIEARDRPGFLPVCRYGTIKPEQNEVGAIVKIKRGPLRVEYGLIVEQCEYLERIFINDQPT
jgi:hypothetical protein